MKSENESEDEVLKVMGVYFCKQCYNLILPTRTNGSMLQFICIHCGFQNVNFDEKRNQACLLYAKEFTTLRRKLMPDVSAVLDQTLPTIEVECPECGHNKAIYFLIPDQVQTKMIARLMCKNIVDETVRCGHIWDLNDESEITGTAVMIKQEEEISEPDLFQQKLQS